MAQVFVSYKRDDVANVQRLVTALKDARLQVWWDQDIPPDAPWETTIEHELSVAKAVIVVWSCASVASENVKAEARRARNEGKLLQVFIQQCSPPLFFGERQGADLSNWNGDEGDKRFQAILAAARALIEGRRPATGVGFAPKRNTTIWRFAAAAFVVVSSVLGFVSDLGGARSAVCNLGGVGNFCRDLNLNDREDTRHTLLASVVGVWGRQDRGCADAVRYSVAYGQGQGAPDRIFAQATAFQSESQVVAVENGVIVARATTPSESGPREQWEFHPDGDRLTVYDKDGIATTLVRCGG